MRGYCSFAGIGAAAKYYGTAVGEVLPVAIHTFDDRVETPEGIVPEVLAANHPLLKGIAGPWPALLGFNELVLKTGAQLILKAGAHPPLATVARGRGRALAWASDIGPHWCPEPFTRWPGYAALWKNIIAWLAGGPS